MTFRLADKLRLVRVGADVSVTYLGLTENPRTERSFHRFDVEADETDVIEPDDDDEQVPF
jgi:hypothetical protein